MSRHKTSYVISYHGILCHDMSYVTIIAASLPCKLIVITFRTFVQFERVRAVLKGVAPDEARFYQPIPDQIPHGRQ